MTSSQDLNAKQSPVVSIARGALTASFLGLAATWALSGCASPRASASEHVEPRTPASLASSGTAEVSPRAVIAPPPRVPTPLDRRGEIPPPGVPWGTNAPLTFVAAAPDRRWLVLCQAARDANGDGKVDVTVGSQGALSGDPLEGVYLDGEGTGEHIDAFVGSDPTGRFVALIEGGRLLLRDSTTRMDIDLSALGADLRDDAATFLNPRAGAFAPRGARFLYLRRDGGRSRVVIRDLPTGGETVLESPPGELYRADFDASGDWVVLRVVDTDTNGDGRLEWPIPEAKGPPMRCGGPLPRYAVWERPHDEPSVFVARSTGSVVTEATGLVAPLADSIVVRDPDGTLVRVRSGNARVALVRKGCAARLLHADSTRGLLLVTCVGKKGRNDALLVGNDFTKPLGLELAAVTGDHSQPGAPRLISLHPGTEAVLVDLDQRSVESLTSGDRILETVGTRALVLRGKSLLVHELGGHDGLKLGDVAPLGHIQRAGPILLVPPLIVDVSSGELLGTTAARPLAVATDGSVLVPDGADADATHLARGPLRWKRPDAPPLPTAP